MNLNEVQYHITQLIIVTHSFSDYFKLHKLGNDQLKCYIPFVTIAKNKNSVGDTVPK